MIPEKLQAEQNAALERLRSSGQISFVTRGIAQQPARILAAAEEMMPRPKAACVAVLKFAVLTSHPACTRAPRPVGMPRMAGPRARLAS
jgi:hypothetical protein